MCDAARDSLAIGFFDGVHRGHQAILDRAGTVVTFRNHPLSVLAPEKAPRMIMTAEARLERMRALGKKTVVLEFDRSMAELEPAEFVAKHLAPLGVKAIYAGENWRFGRGGKADIGWLKAAGFGAETVPYETYLGEKISSTRIRQALKSGDMQGAAAMLGRNWRLSGRVAPGKGEGRKLGFPTINIRPDEELVEVPKGVYEVRLGGKKGIANYGVAPTFGEKAWNGAVCEVHMLEDGADITDRCEAEMVRFIRPERKFVDVEELKAQIRRDVDGILQSV